jgi:hypothetical protein
MKDKLTISDLSNYLPYELQLYNGNHFRPMTKCYKEGTALMVELDYKNQCFTVSCEHNGFVKPIWVPLLIPISEFGAWDEIFMKGLTDSGWEEDIFSLAFEYHDEAVECLIYVNDIKYNCTFSYVNGNLEFNGNIQFNQLAAFNEMFRKHIDLYFLIDKGLALNKNEL